MSIFNSLAKQQQSSLSIYVICQSRLSFYDKNTHTHKHTHTHVIFKFKLLNVISMRIEVC